MVLCSAAGWKRYVEHPISGLEQLFALKDGSWSLSFIEDEDVCRALLRSCSMPAALKHLLEPTIGAPIEIPFEVSHEVSL
jgi:hypothetical protein